MKELEARRNLVAKELAQVERQVWEAPFSDWLLGLDPA